MGVGIRRVGGVAYEAVLVLIPMRFQNLSPETLNVLLGAALLGLVVWAWAELVHFSRSGGQSRVSQFLNRWLPVPYLSWGSPLDRVPLIAIRDRAAANHGWDFLGEKSLHILEFVMGLRQAGLDGQVQFWGRPIKSGLSGFLNMVEHEPLEAILKEHWRDFQIEPMSLGMADKNISTKSYTQKNDFDKGFADLHVSQRDALKWLRTTADSFKGAYPK